MDANVAGPSTSRVTWFLAVRGGPPRDSINERFAWMSSAEPVFCCSLDMMSLDFEADSSPRGPTITGGVPFSVLPSSMRETSGRAAWQPISETAHRSHRNPTVFIRRSMEFPLFQMMFLFKYLNRKASG
jgi:hypothetical protein